MAAILQDKDVRPLHSPVSFKALSGVEPVYWVMSMIQIKRFRTYFAERNHIAQFLVAIFIQIVDERSH